MNDYWMHGQASQTRSGEPIFPCTAKQLAQLVDREVAKKLPCSLTPSEAFSLHAVQLRQIHAAWQTLAPALRQTNPPSTAATSTYSKTTDSS
ncbi:hypothetical protein K4H28_08910 [Deefgea tanakiae]|uniref:Uncharacterized protein n=1 Tax=Deefgea tanakiae TaxID=2865840 RepID=A0ABX8Z4Z7_9NEIS|nr:hypothetical protein [Deefgea tanakiae]QZA76469.1 hypothetical protein K4H28_08910 [Deefgea tanakiae]